jgi:integrase
VGSNPTGSASISSWIIQENPEIRINTNKNPQYLSKMFYRDSLQSRPDEGIFDGTLEVLSMRLTDMKIRSAKPRDKPYRLGDQHGLYLVVTPTGGKLWRYNYRLNQKAQTLSLGAWPIIGLSEARQKLIEAKGLIQTGKHPTREKQAQKLRQVKDGENSFGKVCRMMLGQKSGHLNQKYATQCLTRMEQHVFPLIGDLPITEITIPDVVRVLEKLADRGTVETAKRMKQIISQTFRYATQRGLCAHNPAADMRDILPKTEDKHHACVPIAEFPELLHAMAAYKGDPLTVAAMHLLALTFVRTNELIGAQWVEIDFSREEWHIPKERMKRRKPHIVPLSRQTIAILKALQPITGHREHIFHSGAARAKHISNGAVLMALRRMGYQGRMTGHGFRALASSILYEKEYMPQAIEIQLAHDDPNEVRASYNYQAQYLLERKKMMQDWADYVDDLRNGATTNIIRLRA